MEFQTLKEVIQTYPEYRGQKAILQAFNEEGQRYGRDAERRISLATAARILTGNTDTPQITTYHEHVRFAKRHGLKKFTYHSKKSGRLNTYYLRENQYRQL